MTEEKKPRKGIMGWLAAAGLAILKFLKPLLLLAGKFKTILSMLLFFGVYWAQFGWQWALGFVLCIFVHEMGHVMALRRYGVEASAPMFIPFFGAFIQVKSPLRDEVENARCGMAGPEYGLYASIACFALYFATGLDIFKAIGHTSAFINLFNLVPISFLISLDGHRGSASLSQTQRLMLMVLAAVLAYGLYLADCNEGMVWIIAAVMLWRGLKATPEGQSDAKGAWIYAGLLVALVFLAEFQNIEKIQSLFIVS